MHPAHAPAPHPASTATPHPTPGPAPHPPSAPPHPASRPPPPQPEQRYQTPPEYDEYPPPATPPEGNFQTALGNSTFLPHDPTNPRDREHEQYKVEQAKQHELQRQMEEIRQNPMDARNGPHSQLDMLKRQRESMVTEANGRYEWSGRHAAGEGHTGVIDQADMRMAALPALDDRIDRAQFAVDHPIPPPRDHEMDEDPAGGEEPHINNRHGGDFEHGEDEQHYSQADMDHMGHQGVDHEGYPDHDYEDHGDMGDEDGFGYEEGHDGGYDEDLFGTGHPHQHGLDDFEDHGVH
ncbi:hypothetical protein FOPE_08151 [Fonsecaea pedrosoi]|nr:hypothetical protein FOPE_08151 [Fonsecaea pedrosoi]